MLEKLKSLIKEAVGEETIDGANVEETAEMVDLDIAYSPVVTGRISDDFHLHTIPQPEPVKISDNGRYYIPRTDPPDFEFISKESMKVMRARYLLLRGFYANNIDSFSYSEQQQILAWYFPGGLFRLPKKDKE